MPGSARLLHRNGISAVPTPHAVEYPPASRRAASPVFVCVPLRRFYYFGFTALLCRLSLVHRHRLRSYVLGSTRETLKCPILTAGAARTARTCHL